MRSLFLLESHLPSIGCDWTTEALQNLKSEPDSLESIEKVLQQWTSAGEYRDLGNTVDAWIQLSYESLVQSITENPDWVDTSFLVDYVKEDVDLAALRLHSLYREKLGSDDAHGHWKAKRTPTATPIHIFETLSLGIAEDVKQALENVPELPSGE